MRNNRLIPVSYDTRQSVQSFLRNNPGYVHEHFTSKASAQPGSLDVAPSGIGYLQAPLIYDVMAPKLVAGANEQVSFPTFSDDRFFYEDDLVAPGGKPKRADVGIKWTTLTVQPHGRSVLIEPWELRAFGATGINIVDQKSQLAEEQVALGKEVAVATHYATAGSYASASHYGALVGTDQFSHPSSDPVNLIETWIEFVRETIGRRPTVLCFGPKPFKSVRWHSKILDLLKGANPVRQGIPATAEILAALFEINVVVGEAVYKTAVGGSVSDVWGDNSFLAFLDDSSPYSPKFAQLAESPDYPKVVTLQSDEGAEGSDDIRYLDCYLAAAGLTSAAYWASDCTA